MDCIQLYKYARQTGRRIFEDRRRTIKAVWFSEHASMMCFHDQILHVRSTAIGLLYCRLQFPRGVVYPTTDLTTDQKPTSVPTSVHRKMARDQLIQPTIDLDTESPCEKRASSCICKPTQLLLYTFNPTLAFTGISPAYKCR